MKEREREGGNEQDPCFLWRRARQIHHSETSAYTKAFFLPAWALNLRGTGLCTEGAQLNGLLPHGPTRVNVPRIMAVPFGSLALRNKFL